MSYFDMFLYQSRDKKIVCGLGRGGGGGSDNWITHRDDKVTTSPDIRHASLILHQY